MVLGYFSLTAVRDSFNFSIYRDKHFVLNKHVDIQARCAFQHVCYCYIVYAT